MKSVTYWPTLGKFRGGPVKKITLYIHERCLYLLIFQAVAPGDPNPDCPAEPNIPWMLILGGTGIGLLLLLRIAIVKCLRCIKNNQVGDI